MSNNQVRYEVDGQALTPTEKFIGDAVGGFVGGVLPTAAICAVGAVAGPAVAFGAVVVAAIGIANASSGSESKKGGG